MELLSSPKSEYLLQAGIPVLHVESQEWLNEIAFMEDELKFFGKLLNRFYDKILSPQKQETFEQLKREGKEFKSAVLSDLKMRITQHEHYLANLMQDGNTEDRATYRVKHSSLKNTFKKEADYFRQYKKQLFQWVVK